MRCSPVLRVAAAKLLEEMMSAARGISRNKG